MYNIEFDVFEISALIWVLHNKKNKSQIELNLQNKLIIEKATHK